MCGRPDGAELQAAERTRARRFPGRPPAPGEGDCEPDHLTSPRLPAKLRPRPWSLTLSSAATPTGSWDWERSATRTRPASTARQHSATTFVLAHLRRPHRDLRRPCRPGIAHSTLLMAVRVNLRAIFPQGELDSCAYIYTDEC
ncbi:hypothetical protein ZWY2020_040712 [Hordeum vulgare]|nr:hypothetical protein ZWY2020_040712 [Hordeum vulgare]